MVRKLIYIILLFALSAGLTLGGLNGDLSVESLSKFAESLTLGGKQVAQSAPTFQWIDESGHTVIGEAPPANAKNLKPFKLTKDVSRYSSDALINGFSTDVPEAKPKEPPKPKGAGLGR